MEDGMDRYIGRCMKNWTAKHHPPADGRVKLLRKASSPPFIHRQHPLSEQWSTFFNRFASVNDQFYYPRQWQITGPFTQSLIFSSHLAVNHRLAS